MRKSKRNTPKTNPSFAVVVDGESEVWYLQMLKRNERSIRISIKPEIPDKRSIKNQYDLVCDSSRKEFTKVFWLVDLDTLLNETKAAPKGKQSPLRTFEDYREDLANNYKNVIVIVNNPCLEFWFLLHFIKTSTYFDTCSGAERELKKHLKNYEKTQRFFTKQHDDIYLKLKPHLNTALRNAHTLGYFDIQNPDNALSEMTLLFLSDELRSHFEKSD